MSFKILYQEGSGVAQNLYTVGAYINGFAKGLGIKALNINPDGLRMLAAALASPDFPHRDGVAKASPFKKAGNFFVWFVASKPIVDELDVQIITPELRSIPNHQNVIFAYHMVADCLQGAELHKNGTVVTLKNRIKVSNHFFHDFVDAYASAVPQQDFKSATLLFEQLAYKVNPDAPYEENL
jgi:hypothetical protein